MLHTRLALAIGFAVLQGPSALAQSRSIGLLEAVLSNLMGAQPEELIEGVAALYLPDLARQVLHGQSRLTEACWAKRLPTSTDDLWLRPVRLENRSNVAPAPVPARWNGLQCGTVRWLLCSP